jgi:hypothetical protein
VAARHGLSRLAQGDGDLEACLEMELAQRDRGGDVRVACQCALDVLPEERAPPSAYVPPGMPETDERVAAATNK